jgi:hypothetical protein
MNCAARARAASARAAASGTLASAAAIAGVLTSSAGAAPAASEAAALAAAPSELVFMSRFIGVSWMSMCNAVLGVEPVSVANFNPVA